MKQPLTRAHPDTATGAPWHFVPHFVQNGAEIRQSGGQSGGQGGIGAPVVVSRYTLLTLVLCVLAARLAGGATIVGDWPFDRTADGVAVGEGQAVLEEATAGLFDASGHYGMGQGRHYAGMAPPGPGAAAVYARWRPAAGQRTDGCALDTSCGGVYFLDGSAKLKAAANFSVWTRFQPLNADMTKTEVVLGRAGAWLICRQQGRLAAGVADGAGIHDVFAGNGPLLESGKWYDVGFSLAGHSASGGKIQVYLNGRLIRQTPETSIPSSAAPFQIGGRGLEASFPESKALYDRVVFYDGVLEPRDFVRLTRRGGPPLSVRPTVVEPLEPTFWWNGDGVIGQAAGYRPLKWNPKLAAYCVGGASYPAPGPGGDALPAEPVETFRAGAGTGAGLLWSCQLDSKRDEPLRHCLLLHPRGI